MNYHSWIDEKIFYSIRFGEGKAQIQRYFTPFIHRHQKLRDTGFCWKDENSSEHHTRVTAKIRICDAVAREMVQNFKQFNGEFGCGLCYHNWEMVQKSKVSQFYPLQIPETWRHMAETVSCKCAAYSPFPVRHSGWAQFCRIMSSSICVNSLWS